MTWRDAPSFGPSISAYQQLVRGVQTVRECVGRYRFFTDDFDWTSKLVAGLRGGMGDTDDAEFSRFWSFCDEDGSANFDIGFEGHCS